SSLSLLFRPAAGSSLFPYTTLFRSEGRQVVRVELLGEDRAKVPLRRLPEPVHERRVDVAVQQPHPRLVQRPRRVHLDVALGDRRSEEHTSELQSRENLVCRLLLEKK